MKDHTTIGAILVSTGVLDEDQVEAILEIKSKADLFGQVAVSAGFVTGEQLRCALRTQEGLRHRSGVRRAMTVADLSERASASAVAFAARLRGRIGVAQLDGATE